MALNQVLYDYECTKLVPPGYPRFPAQAPIFISASCDLLPPADSVGWPPCSPLNFKALFHLTEKVFNSGLPNFMGCRVPVYSTFKFDFLRSALQDYHDYQICDLLQYGCPIGFNSHFPPRSEVRNHAGARNFPEHVDKFVVKETNLGATLGPFSSAPFNIDWPCAFSPLNTVPKKDSPDRRIIMDLSWPIGSGVNSHIDPSCYLGCPVDLCFPTVDNFCDLMRLKGKGCLLFKCDLSRAYRQIPVDPADIPLLGFIWRSFLFFDRVLAFGLRSAASLCQRLSCAITFIVNKYGYDIINYIDDFGGAEVPEKAADAYYTVKYVLKSAGAVESAEKAIPPSTSMIFLGILFNSIDMTMSIDPCRLLEINRLVKVWLRKTVASLNEVQVLLGKLQFVCKCVRPGRIFIGRILEFLKSFNKGNKCKKPLTMEIKQDLQWWSNFLEIYNGVSCIPDSSWASPDCVFSTDACLVGGGGICGNLFFHCAFPDKIMKAASHINSLELFTIVLALKLWGQHFKGLKILIFCDNLPSVQALNSGKTKDPFMLQCLREIVFLCAKFQCEIKSVHLPGVENRLADYLSRWEVSLKFRKLFFEATKDFKGPLLDCPVDLALFDWSCNW